MPICHVLQRLNAGGRAKFQTPHYPVLDGNDRVRGAAKALVRLLDDRVRDVGGDDRARRADGDEGGPGFEPLPDRYVEHTHGRAVPGRAARS